MTKYEIDLLKRFFSDRYIFIFSAPKNLGDSYGALINSNPSSNTGKDDIDYQLEIKLNKNKKEVTKELDEISNEGYMKKINTYNEDYNKIIEKRQNYINLDLDLKDILSPKVFKSFILCNI